MIVVSRMQVDPFVGTKRMLSHPYLTATVRMLQNTQTLPKNSDNYYSIRTPPRQCHDGHRHYFSQTSSGRDIISSHHQLAKRQTHAVAGAIGIWDRHSILLRRNSSKSF